MTKPHYFPAGLAVGATLSLLLSGCQVSGSAEHRDYRPAHAQTTVVFQDDYDYYPGYGIYYSRNRHEYVYQNGNAWVRGPEPVGVSVSVLLTAPVVRMYFHDAPERHHSEVVRRYPRKNYPEGKSNGRAAAHRRD